MGEKLAARGFAPEVISSTLEYLKKAGFINDCLLAETLIRRAFETKLCGYGAARLMMYKRGLGRDVVESSLKYDQEAELETLKKLLEKKMRSKEKYQSVIDRKKLWNFLLRKGYSSATIGKVLKYPDNTEEA